MYIRLNFELALCQEGVIGDIKIRVKKTNLFTLILATDRSVPEVVGNQSQ